MVHLPNDIPVKALSTTVALDINDVTNLSVMTASSICSNHLYIRIADIKGVATGVWFYTKIIGAVVSADLSELRCHRIACANRGCGSDKKLQKILHAIPLSCVGSPLNARAYLRTGRHHTGNSDSSLAARKSLVRAGTKHVAVEISKALSSRRAWKTKLAEQLRLARVATRAIAFAHRKNAHRDASALHHAGTAAQRDFRVFGGGLRTSWWAEVYQTVRCKLHGCAVLASLVVGVKVTVMQRTLPQRMPERMR